MGEHSFRYGDERIPYKVCFTPNRTRHVTINVHSNALVHVDAPDGTTENEIKTAVAKRARWIATRREAALQQMANKRPRQYVNGESLLYLGRRYKLLIKQPGNGLARVRLINGRIEVRPSNPSPSEVRAHVLAWYREKARDYFQRRIEAISGQLTWVDKRPPFSLRRMKRQWGNCATDGSLVLNPLLVKAPRECVDYVILHELTHIREHNHSPAFYRVLDRLMPDWRSVKLRLDGMAAELLAS